MKKTSAILVLAILFLFAGNIFPQVNNLKSMEGTWTGQWVNLYYMSSGSINITITVNEVTDSAHGECNIGGNILGISRSPFSADIALNPVGFVASFNSPIWGDITCTGLFNGTYSGVAINCPNPNAQSMGAAGSFTNTHINGIFTFLWGGIPITGTVTITKQDSILAPTGLSIHENPTGTVLLNWTDNSTNELGYRIDRRNTASGPWSEVGQTGANETAGSDASVQPETQYTYRIAAYNATTESEYSDTITITTATSTSVDKNNIIPEEFSLLQNYPNPFNPGTVISYELPCDSKVSLEVYSMSGEYIATLVNFVQTAGKYEVNFDARNKASGIYIFKMAAQSLKSGKIYVDYKKMVLMK